MKITKKNINSLIEAEYNPRQLTEQQFEDLQNQKVELSSLREDLSAYDLFQRCMHSNGIPYDIIKKNEHQYQIQLALAGFSKEDIEVEVKENVLSIRSKDKPEEDVETEDGNVIHKGIAKRHFERTFTIADDTVVKGAELKDGLLSVELERIIPEEKKAKLIDIK